VSLRDSIERLSRGERPKVRLSGRAYSRSPSPGRFDPTEYVKKREEKLQAARVARDESLRRARSRSASPRGRPSPPASRGRPRAAPTTEREGSARRRISRSPAAGPARESGERGRRPLLPSSGGRGREDRGTTASTGGSGGGGDDDSALSRRQTRKTSPPPTTDPARVHDYFKRNAQITDIDARLEALHDFLKAAQSA
jgi:hypothetical protein